MTPQGLEIIPDYISHLTEANLMEEIGHLMAKAKHRSGPGRSKIIRFGWDYLKPDVYLRPIPSFLPIPERIPDCDSVTLNEYEPGRGIGPHFDSKRFAPPIVVLSLGSQTTMQFVHPTSLTYEVYVPSRALVVMQGDAYDTWKHGVVAADHDITPDGKVLQRGLRYSIVFSHKAA